MLRLVGDRRREIPARLEAGPELLELDELAQSDSIDELAFDVVDSLVLQSACKRSIQQRRTKKEAPFIETNRLPALLARLHLRAHSSS